MNQDLPVIDLGLLRSDAAAGRKRIAAANRDLILFLICSILFGCRKSRTIPLFGHSKSLQQNDKNENYETNPIRPSLPPD